MTSISIWKFIATALLSILLTLGAAYAAMNHNAVTKDEVRDMIAPDRATSQELLDEIKLLRGDFARMNREIGEIKGMLDHRR